MKRIILLTILLCSTCLLADAFAQKEFNSVEVRKWRENANYLGSPSGFSYLAEYRKVSVYSSTQDRVLYRRMKGNQKVFSSKMGSYWGAATIIDRSTSRIEVTRFSMYEPSGKHLYTLENPDVLGFILSDRAPSLVGIEGSEGLPETRMRFFSEQGEHKKDIIFKDFMGGSFCADGSRFFALSVDSGLYAYNPEGDLEYNIPCGIMHTVSNDGMLVLSYDQNRLNLYYQSSLTNSTEFEIESPHQLLIASDKRSAVVMNTSRAVCFSLPEMYILWEYRSEDSSEALNTVAYDPVKKLYAFGTSLDNGPEHSFSDRYTRGRAIVLDSNGAKLGTAPVTFSSWSKGFPKVKFSDSDDILWVICHFRLFKVPLK